MREHENRRKRTAAGMVASIVLTMFELIKCVNFGNTNRSYEALEARLNGCKVKEVRKVAKSLQVSTKGIRSLTKAQLIERIMKEKYGYDAKAPYFQTGDELKVDFQKLDPSLQLDNEGQFIKADGILNPHEPTNKIKSPYQRAPSYDYMDAKTKAKHRVATNEAGQAVSRRYSASIKVPLLNPSNGNFKTYADGRIKLVRHEMRVGYLDTNDEERYSGRVKTGTSNRRTATILRQVMIENNEGAYLVWVAILKTSSHLIDSITLPNFASDEEVTQALDSINKAWQFAAQVEEASRYGRCGDELVSCDLDPTKAHNCLTQAYAKQSNKDYIKSVRGRHSMLPYDHAVMMLYEGVSE